ncbi:MAG: TetR/AcrR family transcriptional regulator [Rubrivivax sp.]|nr:TetR/AcrR family transcriptional regulator [Rubrivivax sp.]
MPTRLPTEERQAEIVAAALQLAREFSPALITTGDIATAVGISQGAVFKHFASKDAIWLAAMRWVREGLLASLHAAAQGAATPLEKLGAVFRAHVGYVVEHPGVPRFIFHELQQPSDTPAKQEVRTLLQAYRKLLLRLFEQAVEARQVPATLNREAAATLFVGIVQGLVMQTMLTGRPAAMKALSEPVFALYIRGIVEAP